MNLDTIKNGFYVITKECLTDSESYFDSIMMNCCKKDETIDEPIKRLWKKHGLSQEDAYKFIKVLDNYKSEFSINNNRIPLNNFGLLVNKNKIEPVVWSSLTK